MGRINKAGVYMRQIRMRRVITILVYLLGVIMLIIPFTNHSFRAFDKEKKIVFDISKKDKVLAVKTHGQNVTVYQGEDILSDIKTTDKSFFEYRVSGRWNFIELDKNDNKVQQIKIISKDSKENDKLEIVTSNNKSNILFHICIKDAIWLFMMFLMIGVMIIVFITYNYIKENVQFEKQFFYESFFCIFVLFSVIESEIFQFLVKDGKLLQIIYLEIMMLIGMPILLYVREHIYEKRKKLVNIGIKVSFVIIVIDNILFFHNYINFKESLLISRMIILVVLITVTLWNNHNVCNEFRFLFGLFLGMYIVSGVLLGIGKYTTREYIIKNGLEYTVLCVILFKFIKMREMVLVGKTVDKWECLAHQDVLTGTLNRAAYEERLDDIIEKKNGEGNIAIISCDINNLKLINDGFGHSEGDKYLINCINAISVVISDNTKIYRTGGDEFVIIIEPYEKGQLLEYAQSFEKILMSSIDNEDRTKNISFAYGYAYYKPEFDKDIFDTIKRADKNMYEKKEKMKSSRG